MSLPNLVPRGDNTGSLGTATKRWSTIYTYNLDTQTPLSGSFSGSFQGDGSNLTGVIAEWDGSHVGAGSFTGSLTVSSSFVDFTQASGGVSGSFSGSFVGDGSGLTGITAEWDGTHNGNASITGSLNVTAGITGSLQGTSSWADNAVTASYVDYSNINSAPTIKSGIIAGGFTGNPKTATVTFATPFDDNSYTVTVTGEDNRTFTIESKVSGSFVVNTNSNPAVAGDTFWQAIEVGEFS